MTSAADQPPRSNELLSRTDSRLLIVDVQEKLTPLIPVADQVIANCRRLIQAANILDIPVNATEQYPQGLGQTVPELAELIANRPAKLEFSCAGVLNWGVAASDSNDRHKVVVAGIEAHVCVLQTVFDLMSLGYQPYVPADSVASRHRIDWKTALDRMAASGAVITTWESVLFEWCERAGTPEFKQISQIVRSR